MSEGFLGRGWTRRSGGGKWRGSAEGARGEASGAEKPEVRGSEQARGPERRAGALVGVICM